MATQKQAKTKRMKMSERAQHQMDLHFPGVPAHWLWRRKTNDGYSTLPRTLPIVMQAIDRHSKGQPAGHVLCCLWVRSPDHPMVTIESPAIFASEAGFEGERAVDTWRRRMRTLHALHFIEPKRGPSGDFHYVLLMNPNAVMVWMHRQKLVPDALYARFVDRLAEVGAYGEVEAIEEAWRQEAAAAQPPIQQALATGAGASAPAAAAV